MNKGRKLFADYLWYAVRRASMTARLVYYQAIYFCWNAGVPWSTKIYGKLFLPYVPCRLSLGRACGLGANVTISAGAGSEVVLGDRVSLNTGCIIVASKSIEIGSNVALGEYVSIRDQQHNHVPGSGVVDQGFKVAPVSIGNNTWIGRGVFIGPGTRIGANSIVAANSVVHGMFPDNVLIAGSPAAIKRDLYDSKG